MGVSFSKEGNRILLRFLVLFAFWEAISFPLRILFFGKFYHDPELSKIFTQMSDIYWVIPVLVDAIQALGISFLFSFCKPALPQGLVGGVLFGFVFGITAFLSPALALSQFTEVLPSFLWWVWAGYQMVFSLSAGAINSLGGDEPD